MLRIIINSDEHSQSEKRLQEEFASADRAQKFLIAEGHRAEVQAWWNQDEDSLGVTNLDGYMTKSLGGIYLLVGVIMGIAISWLATMLVS